MYFVHDISSMRYVPVARDKEFISYRNGAKRSYIAFEQGENISHERSEYIAIRVASKPYVLQSLCKVM